METTEITVQTKWKIDPAHSEIAFKIKHLMIAHVKGTFKMFDGSIYTTGKDFTNAEIDLWIDASSINTNDPKRDEHLKSSEFFDVENHKQITFTSRTIGKPDEKGNHELWGELTMKGITKNLKLDVQFGGIAIDPWGNEKVGFTLTGKLNRNDWGITMNTPLETGGFMMGEEVSISCEIELSHEVKKDSVTELKNSSATKNTAS